MKVLFGFLFGFVVFSGLSQIPTSEIEITQIWSEGDHNAFTDLIFFKGKYYCSFREGSGHVPGEEDVDGKVRIIMSDDGKDWSSVALMELPGYDLRDPKLSIMPDGRLMVIMGGSDYTKNHLNGRMPHVSYSDDGLNFSKPLPVKVEESARSAVDWLWRITWHKGVGYTVNYQYDEGQRAYVLKTTDGLHYELVSELFVSGRPNEATIRFGTEDEMLIYLRREEQGKEGLLLESKPPYQKYTWVNLKHRLGGPNFILLPNTDKLILGTRLYSDQGAKTGLWLSDRTGKTKLLTTFPSGGDTSYPGFVWRAGYLWVSYYASHEGKTNIYLAKIPQSSFYQALMHF